MGAKGSWALRRNAEIDESLVVTDLLGGGTRYEVYRAWDRSLLCEVAVKVLRPDRVEDERARAAFARERDIASGLAHPNVVRLLRWRETGSRPYLVWELVTAPSLDDHLTAVGAIGVAEACLLGIRICAALHHLHSRAVLHLDVKPSNVTIGDPPRLLDLSLARRAPEPLKLDRIVGTDGYMAPEQCLREHLTPATDLFGLGAVLYEALTAMRPFSEGDRQSPDLERRYPQLVEEPLPPSHRRPVPASLQSVVLACLHREPARRPGRASDVALELLGALGEVGRADLAGWPKHVAVVGTPTR